MKPGSAISGRKVQYRVDRMHEVLCWKRGKDRGNNREIIWPEVQNSRLMAGLSGRGAEVRSRDGIISVCSMPTAQF